MSVGFVINETKDSFILASDFTTDLKNGKYVIAEAGNTMVIPTKNVLKIVPIPLKIQAK
jgi:hypothetical protein|tara:strand:+ start:233 stop:409 length:177 start_codon:yes stop_codon:yes gene_type:complete